MHAHYLQHVPFEGLGSIEDWLLRAGYLISSTQFHQADDLPVIDNIDLLIVMGGPMSVNDIDEYPWLTEEKRYIQEVILAGKPVLGICLGAQLIASSMGAEIFNNPEKEIGWFPVKAVKSENKTFQFPGEIEVFHWHGETFSLPSGAVRIAENECCKNQAFQLGDRVIGLQFHLETTPTSAQAIVANCKDELVDGQYIQTEVEILSTPDERYRSINSLMESVLEYLQESIGTDSQHRT